MTWILSALLLGLAGSLHCLGMCGPVFLATGSLYSGPREYVVPLLLHLLGKTLAYILLGMAMGLLGQMVSLLWFQNKLMIVSGILLLLMAAGGLVQIPAFQGIGNWTTAKMGTLLRKKHGSLLLGVINGFIPCGLVYAAAVGSAATGNMLSGAVFMAVFGLGTMPVLAATGFSRWLVKIRPVRNMKIWKQVPVLILGIWLLLKGLGLGIPYISPDLGSHEPAKNCCSKHHSPRH
ncbi:MAG: sulfite exporter TauE/SafE family protein [Bacteroidetes bacterium]|nr:sulfite exporter TauE/SafE family protein [Bacteroidota bacterium]